MTKIKDHRAYPGWQGYDDLCWHCHEAVALHRGRVGQWWADHRVFIIALTVTILLQGTAFWTISAMEDGDLSGWVGHPVGWFCIILSLLTAQFIDD